MKRLLALIALVLVLSPLAGTTAAHASGEGLHPWDRPGRVRKQDYRSQSWTYASIDAYYYSRWRTKTHALHPYYRWKYPDLGYDGNRFQPYFPAYDYNASVGYPPNDYRAEAGRTY